MFQALDEPPLLVISSDMNHFASQEENRRRDQMALKALGTGDAGTLFQTCAQNEISMCGLLPAMTVMQALQALGPLKGINLTGYADSSQANNDKSRVVGYAGVIFS
jgi:AmmeMemoRadiSam system protein B